MYVCEVTSTFVFTRNHLHMNYTVFGGFSYLKGNVDISSLFPRKGATKGYCKNFNFLVICPMLGDICFELAVILLRGLSSLALE